MNSTKLSTTRTPVANTLSEIVFGGSSNSYYADARTRRVFGYIETNVHGEHIAHVAIARSIDFAENQLDELLVTHHIASSPVYKTMTLASGWAASAVTWVVEHFDGRSPFGGSDFPLDREAHSHCSGCGHFDTLSTQMLAYGNLTTCSTEGCDAESYFSIGD